MEEDSRITKYRRLMVELKDRAMNIVLLLYMKIDSKSSAFGMKGSSEEETLSFCLSPMVGWLSLDTTKKTSWVFNPLFWLMLVLVKVSDKLVWGLLQFGIRVRMDLIKGLEEKKLWEQIWLHWGKAKVLHYLESHHLWGRLLHTFHLHQERLLQLHHLSQRRWSWVQHLLQWVFFVDKLIFWMT